MNLFNEPEIMQKKTNPLMAIYGTMDGKKCGQCEHHFFRVYASSYPKCAIRESMYKRHTGKSTDHSSRLPACGKFKEKVK